MARCRYCRQTYDRKRMTQKCCEAVECAIKAGQARKAKEAAKKAKADRAEFRARKEALKPIQHFLKATERACHAYIRERDKDQPCISCGTWDALEFHAGHFIPVGRAKSIRYDDANISKQCDECNVHLNGNATAYEVRLIAKIGKAEVERLKTAPKEKKWTREELKEIAATYRAKLKALNEAKVWHNHPQETAGHLEGE